MKKIFNTIIDVNFGYILNVKKLIIMAFMGVSAINSLAAVKLQNNDLYFYYGPGISSLKIDYKDSEVTKGQPWFPWFCPNKIIEDDNTNALFIRFHAGRECSKEIADQFFKIVHNNAYNLQYALGSDGRDVPTKADFFIITKLYINGSKILNNFYLAQSSRGLIGTWWVGNLTGIPHQCRFGIVVKSVDNTEYYIGALATSGGKFQVAKFRNLNYKCPVNTNALWNHN